MSGGVSGEPAGFVAWETRRDWLGQRLIELAEGLEAEGADGQARRLRQRAEALAREVFRLMVVGEFKRGKSTLINALIGAEVLPAKVAPCTAAITVVRYGASPRAWLVRDAVGEDGRTAEAIEEIPIHELRQWVVREGQPDSLPVRRIEVEVPMALLRHGVEIVDSPGLNEHRVRSDIALDFLPRSDALVVVLSCEQALAATELQFLDEQVGDQLRHVFFVWNRFDAIAQNPDDVADLAATTARWLTPRLDPACKEPRVHHVSARDALRSRLGSQNRHEAKGGINELEAALEGFLGAERAPVKLAAPTAAARAAVLHLQLGLDERERLLDVPLAALRERYTALTPDLERLEQAREGIVALLDPCRERMVARVVVAWEGLVDRLRAALPGVVAGVDLAPVSVLTGAQGAEQRLVGAVERWFQEELRSWEARELQPAVDEELQLLQTALDHQLRQFVGALDAVRDALRPNAQVRVEGRASEPTAAERLAGALGGLLLGGVGAAMEGAAQGPDGMLRGLRWHLPLGLGLFFAGAGAPVVLAAGAALGAARLVWAGLEGAERAREAVIRGTDEALSRARVSAAADLEIRVEARFLEVGATLHAGCGALVTQLRSQVEAVLAEQAAGEAAVEAARGAIGAARARLSEIGSGLDAA